MEQHTDKNLIIRKIDMTCLNLDMIQRWKAVIAPI